jgi:hypothetical protein
MQSVRETNPDYRRYLILADKQPLENICSDGLFEVIEADALGIDCFDDMALRYDVMEFNTAIKPFAIDWLFENTDAGHVVYLDPDICVYRELSELNEVLASGASVVVTPHLTKPLEDGKAPNDYHMLQAGVFNLGFFAASRKPEAREFIRWWSRRLKTMCHADFSQNMFTDQRWVDLAPCFVSAFHILRSSAYNVAYWNLMQRSISDRNGRLHFDGEELAFFHFSGLDRGKLTIVSKHQDRLKWQDIRPLHSLFKDYRFALTDNGWIEGAKVPYHYDRVDGTHIASVIRRLYRRMYPDGQPEAAFSAAFVIAFCNQPAGLSKDALVRITRLMEQVYRERADLQLAFDLSREEGVTAFCLWFSTSAGSQYKLDQVFVDPDTVHASLGRRQKIPPPVIPQANSGKPYFYRKWRKFRKWILSRNIV